jgi:hypothetical protein
MKLIYLYIACRGHSGSTLLESLLGNHPEIFTTGEICHFGDYYQRADQYCACGALLAECPFWNNVVAALTSPQASAKSGWPTDTIRSGFLPAGYSAVLLWFPLLFRLWQGLPGSLAQRNTHFLRNHWQLIAAVAQQSQARVIVDKSMSASRLLELYHTRPPGVHLKAIHLIRDGRANMYSMLRISRDSPADLARQWQQINRNIVWVTRRIPPADRYDLRYEDLCRAPAETLAELCRFIGVSYDPAMVHLQSGTQHGIGGNPMRFRGDRAITLDERWKQQLSAADLAVFEKIAGKTNRAFGYV